MTVIYGPDGEALSLDGDGATLEDSLPEAARGALVNETGLPDDQVYQAVATYIEESAILGQGTTSLDFAGGATSFQSWPATQGASMLAKRGPFRPPWNIFEEIKLARQMADTDDDIGATIGAMLALAFGQELQNQHQDEVTVALFNEITKDSQINAKLKEMYREYLISGQVTTVSLFSRQSYSFIPDGTDRYRTRAVSAPFIGVLPAEFIRVVDNDIFGTGTLAFFPEDSRIQQWLRERFNPTTSPARLAEMRREDPVSFAMFTEAKQMPYDSLDNYTAGQVVYLLNPRMCYRTCMPKGAAKYPRPPLTRNFPLLEAKRLLNIMDHALLAGGANFLVIAKKGSDDKPALPAEVANLRDVIKRAAHTGVIVGDHRIDIEIVTPELKELLNSEKRRLLGKKLAMALLRVPEHVTENPGQQGMSAETEVLTQVITSDRNDLVSHVESKVYEETAQRNPQSFQGGPPSIWHPKIVLQGTNYFTDYILKSRDRGDIPRRYAVEAAGFNYDAAVQQRKREKASGDDKVMTPAQVPFSSPNAGPQDNGGGRPPGAQTGAEPDRRPKQTIQRNAGETVKAIYDEEQGRVVRIGDLTQVIMEEYAGLHIGRVSSIEREAVDGGETRQRGPVVVVPVNPDIEVTADLQAVRLDGDTSLIVGTRAYDGAKVTKALSFKAPRWKLSEAEDQAVAWGFHVELRNPDPSNE